jgi:hypothetical protein
MAVQSDMQTPRPGISSLPTPTLILATVVLALVPLAARGTESSGPAAGDGRDHWAFQRPELPAVPAAAGDWARTDVDRFLGAALETAGVRPVADAERATLARRLFFDLVGLPPTPTEVEAFVADPSPDAVASLVDRLLASSAFGERWARHWLDVARYAESNGKESNFPYPHAWRYRDWVIGAFNADLPYDEFLRRQIAGDLLRHGGPSDQARKIAATGFLALGPKGLNERDRRQFRMDMVDEQIDVVSQAMLGLTIACARCHDHPFDAVTQRDYYALAGIFLSTDTLYGTYQQQQNTHASTLIELDTDAGLPAAVAPLTAADLERLRRRMTEFEESAAEIQRAAMAARTAGDQSQAVSFLQARVARDRVTSSRSDLDLFRADGTPRTLVMGALDRPEPVDAAVLLRGELDQADGTVPRGLVEVLCRPDEPRNIAEGSGRLDLAFWIASRDNPLTARVLVNRVWLKLMGRGLVATPDNFGVMGEEPTHPDLLDHLAVTFMEDGWSLKRLIRRIVLSRGYQLASTHDATNHALDPDNRLHWRMDKRRLDAEAIRDAMLAVSDRLDPTPEPGSPVARLTEDRQGVFRMLGEMRGWRSPRRSIYLPIVRDQIPEFLSVFDFPDASLVSGARDATNVPAQGLFLLNNPEVVDLATAFAARVAAADGPLAERLAAAFALAFGRRPGTTEREAAALFVARSPDTDERRLLETYCQALFASAEFRYLD